MHLSAKMHFALYTNTSDGSAHSKLSIWYVMEPGLWLSLHADNKGCLHTEVTVVVSVAPGVND